MNLIDLFSSQTATKQSEYGDEQTPTVDSVGAGGVSSAANDLLNWIGRGADVYKNIKGASTVVPPNSPSGTTPGTKTTLSNMPWLPWALAGVVLLIIGLIFFRRS